MILCAEIIFSPQLIIIFVADDALQASKKSKEHPSEDLCIVRATDGSTKISTTVC